MIQGELAISFVGSSNVAKYVYSQGTANGKRVQAQGGAKNPLVVMPDADAVILFSCAGRILSLGPLMSKEIEGIYKVWNAPMAGFFCNGEIGPIRGVTHLHGYTSVFGVFRPSESRASSRGHG